MEKILLFGALLLMTFSSCGDTNLVLDFDDSAKLGATFNLKHGKTTEIEKTLLSLTLTKVDESRCPTGTDCVWAGEGKVSFLAKHAEESETLVLKVKGLCDESKGKCGEIKNFRGYDIEIISLLPYPKEGKKPSQTDYVAKLKVMKGRM